MDIVDIKDVNEISILMSSMATGIVSPRGVFFMVSILSVVVFFVALVCCGSFDFDY